MYFKAMIIQNWCMQQGVQFHFSAIQLSAL